MLSNTVVRYLVRHPWVALAAGVGVSAISIARIRRERQEKKAAKGDAKGHRQELKAGKASRITRRG